MYEYSDDKSALVPVSSGLVSKHVTDEAALHSDVCALAFDKDFTYSPEAAAAWVHRSGGAGLLSTGADYLKFLTSFLASYRGDLSRPR